MPPSRLGLGAGSALGPFRSGRFVDSTRAIVPCPKPQAPQGAVMLSTVPTPAPERGRGRDSERRGPGLRPEVLGLDTLEAVRQLGQEGILDPGVLVFASDTNPGGSRKGANIGTQEEALCRLSTLRLAQEQLEYPIPVLGVAYIPQVQGLRPDFFNGQSIDTSNTSLSKASAAVCSS